MDKKCLTDEIIACLAEGLLKGDDLKIAESHITECSFCMELLEAQKACVQERQQGAFNYAPAALIKRAQELVLQETYCDFLDIALSFKERILEVIKTTGEILPAFNTAFAIRGDQDDHSVSVIREIFNGIQILVEVSRQADQTFRVILRSINQQTQAPVDDLRITLFCGETELESYVALNGRVVFESLLENDYSIRISRMNTLVGSVRLSLRKL